MKINYHSLFTLIAVAIALLPGFLLLDRWWRERIYDLSGKTILITGGSRGLGLVLARQLIDAGAQIAICARGKAELQRAVTELEQRGGDVFAVTCNVTDQAQVEQMMQQVRERFGAIDILINNAGMDIVGPLETLTMQDYDDINEAAFLGSTLHNLCGFTRDAGTQGWTHCQHFFDWGQSCVPPHGRLLCQQICLSWTIRRDANRTGKG